MKKTLFTLTAITMVLTACTPDENQKRSKPNDGATSVCQNPAVVPYLRDDLQKMVQQEVQRFTTQDSRDYVDGDKIVAATTQLKFTLNSVQEKNGQCSGRLNITIPKNVLRAVYDNAPYLDMASPDEIITQRLGADSPVQFNGSTVIVPLNYQVHADKNFALNYADNAFSSSASALAAALLPYGVRETVLAGNVPPKRIAPPPVAMPPAVSPNPNTPATAVTDPNANPEDPALLAQQKEQEAKRQAALKAAREKAKAKAEAEAKAKAEAAKVEAAKATEKSTEKPVEKAVAEKPLVEEPAEPAPRVSDAELERERAAHHNADREIKSSWKKIAPEVQKELVDEQRGWERQKNQRCRQAAAKGGDDSEAQKLYMECDTRATKERVQYLRGYSID